jgi:cell division protein FtsL
MAVTARQLQEMKEHYRSQPQRGRRREKLSESPRERSGIRRATVLWVQGLTALMVIFLLALGLILTETAVANRGYELAGLRVELKEARMQTDLLEAEVASLGSTERIVGVAEDQLGLVRTDSYAAVTSILNDSPEAPEGGEGAASTARAEDGSGTAGRRVVLHLESEPASHDGVRLADVGTWLLRWLRGTTPVRASTR